MMLVIYRMIMPEQLLELIRTGSAEDGADVPLSLARLWV